MITLSTFLIELDVLVFVAVVFMSEAVSFRFTIVRLCIRNVTIDTIQLKKNKFSQIQQRRRHSYHKSKICTQRE